MNVNKDLIPQPRKICFTTVKREPDFRLRSTSEQSNYSNSVMLLPGVTGTRMNTIH